MKIKASELTGAALDWAVAKCEFKQHVLRFVKGSEHRGNREEYTRPRFVWVQLPFRECTLDKAERLLEVETNSYYCPSISWGIGGPIIERERIALTFWDCAWDAKCVYENDDDDIVRQAEGCDPTPLIAAMRCYVASVLGDEVDVPEELK